MCGECNWPMPKTEFGKWISVEDRLPIYGKPVLLYQTYPPETAFHCRADPIDRHFQYVGALAYNGKFLSQCNQYDNHGLKHITHWMPLPKAPNE